MKQRNKLPLKKALLIGRSNVTYTKNIITKTFCDNKKNTGNTLKQH